MDRRIAALLALVLVCGCTANDEALQRSENERWKAQEAAAIEARRARLMAEQAASDEKMAQLDAEIERQEAERQAQEAKKEADRLAALRTRIAAAAKSATSLVEFEDIYDDCEWGNVDIKLEVEASLRKWYLKRYHLPPIIRAAIEAQSLVIGMTPEQAIASWGFPRRVHNTTTSSGVHQQWLMPGDSYLYFENDKLTGWQN